jgi:hypothetical protein
VLKAPPVKPFRAHVRRRVVWRVLRALGRTGPFGDGLKQKQDRGITMRLVTFNADRSSPLPILS